MSVINQLPASGIVINAKAGDSLTVPFDFSINMTGYTIALSCPGVTTSMSNTLSTGIINVTFTTTGLNGSYPWTLKWTTGAGVVRTALAGDLVVS
jgi:hypothetical protein